MIGKSNRSSRSRKRKQKKYTGTGGRQGELESSKRREKKMRASVRWARASPVHAPLPSGSPQRHSTRRAGTTRRRRTVEVEGVDARRGG